MKNKTILAFIVVFFLVTRLFKIGEIPSSVYWDEASIGYNAFSIATDLKDEWGNFLPVHFRAFGEFKLPVYIYSVVPFVKIFGLSAVSVRFPAVLYSLGTVLIVYFLVRKITGRESISLLSAFILTTSPWFFLFSRTGYEATAGVFFFMLGIYIAMFIEKNKLLVLMSSFSFILSFYSYNSFRIIIPIWLIFLFIYYFYKMKEKKKYFPITILSAVFFLTSLVPIYRLYKFDTGGARFSQVRVENAMDFFGNYVKNFSPSFLFTNGDTNPRSQIPGRGELFLIDFPLIILGIYYSLRKKNFWYLAPIILMIIAPIPTAITKESPHALRSLLLAPTFAILSAFGIFFLTEKMKYHRYIIPIIVVIYYLFFESYATDFVLNFQRLSADAWQYQYKEIFLKQTSGIVTDKYAEPYIFALFYQKIPPSEFRNTVKYNPPDKWGFSLVSSFNKFEFKNIK